MRMAGWPIYSRSRPPVLMPPSRPGCNPLVGGVSLAWSTGARMGATHRASKGFEALAGLGWGRHPSPTTPSMPARRGAGSLSCPSSRRMLVGSSAGRVELGFAFAFGQAHNPGYFLAVRRRIHLAGLGSRDGSPAPCWKHPGRPGRSASRNKRVSMKIGKEGNGQPHGWEGRRTGVPRPVRPSKILRVCKIFPTRRPTVEGAIT